VTTTTFAELGLAEPLLRALNDAQYTTPTPIQAQSIPVLLEGRDLLGLAETGTGKTAAFVLPMLHRLAAEGGRAYPGSPRALILAPTRELAIQIGESIAVYGRNINLSHTVIYGGVGQRPQVNAIGRGVDILVATPGRLLDLIDQRHLRLNQVQTFVLDEADRMLDMGFVRDVRRILKMVPSKRHSLLFSATMPDDIAKLAAEFLSNPARVEIARTGKTVDRIDQRVMFLSTAAKRDMLGHMLQDPELRRVIVFTRTKRGADRVSKAVEMMGVGVHAIHGNKSQGQRQSALDSFRKGFTRVLVATDIAARGIDIDEITHVINYELPNIPESYVHRIGRTARAGASGIAIAFCAPDEREYLRDIERLIKRRLDVVSAPAGMERSASRDVASASTADESESRADAPERRPARGRPHQNGPRPQRDGERPRRDAGSRADGGRPRRDGDGARNGAPRGDRPRREGDAPRNGDSPRNGAQRSGERRHADGHAPRNGHSPRNGDAPRSGEGRSGESAQPWRNWTRDGEQPARPRGDRPAHSANGDGAGRSGGREGANRDEPRKDRHPGGRPDHGKSYGKGPRSGGAPQARSGERRGDSQGRGRATR
jgi:ATP-dependent RNA helicase RhlE